eukprot:c46141_g1_i1 orf=75-245(+)
MRLSMGHLQSFNVQIWEVILFSNFVLKFQICLTNVYLHERSLDPHDIKPLYSFRKL